VLTRLCAHVWYFFPCSSAHLPSVLLLMRQRRDAAGNGLSTGLSTTVKYVRCTASGAAGNSLGTTIKYLRCTRNNAAGSGLGITIKPLFLPGVYKSLRHPPLLCGYIRDRIFGAGPRFFSGVGTTVLSGPKKTYPLTSLLLGPS
jgi:hypothetical protein